MTPVRKKTKRLFTPAEDAALRACWMAAASSEDIRAAGPGRLFATLVGRAEILGLPKRRFRPVRGVYLPPRYKAAKEMAPEAAVDDRRYVQACISGGGFPHLHWHPNLGYVPVWPFERRVP